MKKLFGIFAVVFLALGLTMSSCTKEETWTDADNFVFGTYKEFRDGPLGGHHHCYKVIFPVTIMFPDGTEQEVQDREELLTVLRSWKEANPDATERPTIKFPISVTNKDGDTIVVETLEQAKEMRKECRVENDHKKCKNFGRFLNNKCFKVELPISIVMADGEIIEISNRRDIAKLLRDWKNERPEEVPELMYPITVTLKSDNSEFVVENAEAFEALIADCKG